VIICTRNRASSLVDAIRSLLVQDFPSDAYEIVIVDNGSTDNTQQIVHEFAEEDVTCRYEFESVLGLPRARNSGAQASRGELLAYIDDDALADRGWLKAMVAAHLEALGQLAVIGGKSELLWEGERPGWITDDLLPYLSDSSHLGETKRILNADEFPVGVNLSIRKDLLINIGGFDTSLPPYGNDEVELCTRLRALGGAVNYAPEASVKHRVSGERVTLKYFVDRFFRQGAADVLMENRLLRASKASLFRSCIALVIQISWDAVRYFFLRLSGHQTLANHRILSLAGRLGRLRCQLELVFNG